MTAALVLLFRDCDDAALAQALTAVERGDLIAGDFVVARSGGRVVGAMLARPLAGAAGVVWPPVADGRGIEDALVAAAGASLKNRGSRFVHAFVPPELGGRAGPLVRGGYERVTALTRMTLSGIARPAPHPPGPPSLRGKGGASGSDDSAPSSLSRTVDAACSPFPLREGGRGVRCPPDVTDSDAACSPLSSQDRRSEGIRPCSPADALPVLLASYDGTLDGPELNDLRTPDEVLAGQVEAAPDVVRWWLAERDGEPAGVLILADSDRPDEWDVSYLGVAPRHRRRGLGRRLVAFAIDRAAEAGVGSLTLSVDTRNGPARGLYESFGFRVEGLQDVYLKARL